MLCSAEYKRGYDAGYKQGLLDALKQQRTSPTTFTTAPSYPIVGKPSRKIGGEA